MDCAGCGRCCDPVWLAMTPLELAADLARMADGRRVSSADGETNLRFIGEHMVPLDPQPELYMDGRPAETSGHLAYRCDAYDPESKLCTAHDDRPPICRGYPWYGETPAVPEDGGSVLTAGCSHFWDLPVIETRGELQGRLLPLWPVGSTA